MNILSNFIKNKIKTVLSDYLSDSERNPIQMEIASDELSLKNVYLNTSVLNRFLNEQPVRLVEGVISNLVVRIPWASLFASPLEVRINEMIVICETKDPSAGREEDLINREVVLQRLFNALKSHVQSLINQDDDQQDNTSFLSNIKNKIIDNIQLKLSNIAVQLNVPFGISKPIFELRIMDLSVFTSDERFENQVFFDRALPQFENAPVCKVAKLEGLTFVIEDANTKVLENEEDAAKRYLEYKNVFKLNLKVEARLKTNRVADDKPKYWARMAITLCKFNLTERKMNHIFDLLEIFDSWNREIDLFYSYYAQKPKHRLNSPELEEGAKGVVSRRWWLYCGTLVMKDLHVKKSRDAWNQLISTSSIVRKSTRNIRLPHFMLSQFKEPVQQLLEELIAKDWKVETFSNNSRVLDLETILFSVPEKQLQQLINQTCQGIIELERRKKKGKSFIKKLLRKLGLWRDNPEKSELVDIIEENVAKDESFEQRYVASIQFDFALLKVNLMTDYGSVFGLEANGFQAAVEKHIHDTQVDLTFKTFRLFFKNGNNLHPIFFSNRTDSNFVDATVGIHNDGKRNAVTGTMAIRATTWEIRKEMFDEVYLFLQNWKQRKGRFVNLQQQQAIVQNNLARDFEKTLKNLQTDIDFKVTMDSIAFVLFLDSANVRRITVNTGRLKLKVVMANSIRQFNYIAQVQNMGVDYYLQGVKHTFLDLSLYANISSENNVSFKAWMVSREVLVNVKSLLLLDMMNALAIFKERNLQMTNNQAPKMLKEFQVPYAFLTGRNADPSDLTEAQFVKCLLQVNKNKTFNVVADAGTVNTQNFSQLSFKYYRKFGKYLLKVG